MEKRKWNASKLGEMTFENICRLYSSDKNINFANEPPYIRAFYAKPVGNQYAVRWNKYEACANFDSETVGMDYYILKGKCEITVNKNAYELQTRECLEFPECEYHFKVIGSDVFEYVAVYKLPDDFPVIK